MQPPLPGLPLRDSATFDSFYEGKNQQIVTFLKRMLAGEESEQFVYLWGEKGAGVSHLLQASCQEMARQQQTSMYISLLKKTDYSPQLFESLEMFQLVCLDDVDDLEQDVFWQQAVFHLYNRLRDSQRKLIVAAHKPPQELKVLPDLQSRLAWGLTYEVQCLTDDEKIKALQLRANTRGFDLAHEVAQFILRRVPRNMTELFATFDQLDAAAIAAQRRMTIPFVKSILMV